MAAHTSSIDETPFFPPAEDSDNPPSLLPLVPRWVTEVLGPEAEPVRVAADIQGLGSASALLLTASLAHADRLSAEELRAGVADAYAALGAALAASRRHPIRVWNFIPQIGTTMGPGLDRYMVFNAGRFDGYTRWSAPSRSLPSLPTASAIGVDSADLVIHCLASAVPGTPIENPRQKSPWLYSARYGPIPPCFSRATIATVGARRLLLIGGTASIVGEDSLHGDDVSAQLTETLSNLEALIGVTPGSDPSRAGLERLSDIHVYVPRQDDARAILSAVAARCAPETRIALTIARLCRPELLVEIEGTADI